MTDEREAALEAFWTAQTPEEEAAAYARMAAAGLPDAYAVPPEMDLARARAEIERLVGGIRAFLAGDYDNPRSYRPGECPHGTPYYQECGSCDDAHFSRLIGAAP